MTISGKTSSSPAAQILEYIQRHGQATIKELEALLGVSTTAVREQLAQLQIDGLVAAGITRQSLGRPKNVYTLTVKAQRLAPKGYDVLISLLLREITAEQGSSGLERILAHVSERLAQQYAIQVTGTELAERLGALQATLEQHGIPADVAPGGDGLAICACPYFEVIQEHASICTMERQMIERLIGEKIVLQQSIRDGHHSCHFAVIQDS